MYSANNMIGHTMQKYKKQNKKTHSNIDGLVTNTFVNKRMSAPKATYQQKNIGKSND